MSRILPHLISILGFSLLITLTSACGGDGATSPSPPSPPPSPTPPPTPVATSITITPASATLNEIGQTVQLTAQVFDQNNGVMASASVTWTSRDPGIASVSTAGLVTAVKYGTTRIVAMSGNASQDVEVKVTQTVGRIVIEPTEATLTAIGETVQLAASVQDRDGQPIAGANVTWQSSDSAVASVSATGLVTSTGNGTTRITARSGSTEQGITVTVMQAPTGIAIDPPEADLTAIGETVQLIAKVVDPNNRTIEGAGVTWQSNDENVATVSAEGLVTAVNNGDATITAASGDLSESVDVTVSQAPASIVIDPASAKLAEAGDTVQLTAVVLDLNGHRIESAEVTWSSSDEAIATVDDQGLVTGVASGSVEITARTGEVSSASLISVAGSALDRETLTAFYEATNGGAWTNNENWLSDAPLGDWYGIRTNFAGEVTGIELPDNNLRGPIPAELCQLSTLEKLVLPFNELTGIIPPDLGLLTELDFLWLASNELTGNIPPELGQLTNLEMLWLGDNRLTGEIPSEFGQLASLSSLSIEVNELTGMIPPELGQLTSLTEIQLRSNKLTGNLPPELGQLFNLSVLWLDGNGITGSIPSELGQTKLVTLSLHGNNFTGDIPPELMHLADLTVLDLSGNGLTGRIPPELGQLTRLDWLRLGNNRLAGTIPPELGQLTNLTELGLENNRLTGAIPPELGLLANLTWLRLWENALTGNIPPELGQLTNLEGLGLEINALTGNIPAELGQLTRLEWIGLESNPGLTGPLPDSFTGLKSVNVLTLSDTGLCVPSTSTFRAWIEGIETADGVQYCSAP